jgi:hypothetical protein
MAEGKRPAGLLGARLRAELAAPAPAADGVLAARAFATGGGGGGTLRVRYSSLDEQPGPLLASAGAGAELAGVAASSLAQGDSAASAAVASEDEELRRLGRVARRRASGGGDAVARESAAPRAGVVLRQPAISSGRHVPRSLKESTLGGLIVNHRDWQSKRFNALLNEEIRMSNESFSKQALLFDPIVGDMALQMAMRVEELTRGVPGAAGAAEACVRVFQHVVLRRAGATPEASVRRWLQCLRSLLQGDAGAARLMLLELATGQPAFDTAGRQLALAVPAEQAAAQLERLQKLSQALQQVGKPLLTALGIRAQLLECDSRPAFFASLALLRIALRVTEHDAQQQQQQPQQQQHDVALRPAAGSGDGVAVANKNPKQPPAASSADALRRFLTALVAEHAYAASHTRLLELYGQVWVSVCAASDKATLRACVQLDAPAVLVHLILGARSPGQRVARELGLAERLAELPVPEGLAVADVAPLVRAVAAFESGAPILPALSSAMLDCEELRAKLCASSLTSVTAASPLIATAASAAEAPAAAQAQDDLLMSLDGSELQALGGLQNHFQALLVQVSARGPAAGLGKTLKFLTDAIVELSGFLQYSNGQLGDKTARAAACRQLVVRLATSQSTYAGAVQVVDKLCDAVFEEFKRCVHVGTPPDAPPPVLARSCAKRVVAGNARFGSPQAAVALLSCLEEVAGSRKEMAKQWIPGNKDKWLPMVKWMELVSPPLCARGFPPGFPPGFCDKLLRKLLAMRRYYAKGEDEEDFAAATEPAAALPAAGAPPAPAPATGAYAAPGSAGAGGAEDADGTSMHSID